MSRTQRIQKLAHAIKEYRGAYIPGSMPRQWIRYPKPSAKVRVLNWLERLGVKELTPAMEAINNFESHDAMVKWLTELEQKETTK